MRKTISKKVIKFTSDKLAERQQFAGQFPIARTELQEWFEEFNETSVSRVKEKVVREALLHPINEDPVDLGDLPENLKARVIKAAFHIATQALLHEDSRYCKRTRGRNERLV